jgi:hypothetical protein
MTMRAQTAPTPVLRELATAVGIPHLLLWLAFIIIFPFYAMPSGLPQPSTAVALLLMLVLVATVPIAFRRDALPAVQLLLLFVAYVVLINVMWATALGRFSLSGRDGLLIHPSYYVFNAAICLAGIVLNARFGRAFILITTYGAVLSVLLQTVASVFVHGGGDSRGMLFFNSPNQLGYYAVLCSTIVVFGAKRVPVSRWIVAGVFFSSGYLAVISMSRAAIIAVGVLAVLTLLSRPSAMLLAFGLFMAAFQLFDPAGEVLEPSVVRLQSISETDPGRGYDRIWQHPEYWLMGAGEGALDRFPDT